MYSTLTKFIFHNPPKKKETGIKENKRLLFIVFTVKRKLNRSSIFLDEPYHIFLTFFFKDKTSITIIFK